jgi:hypothetical protein
MIFTVRLCSGGFVSNLDLNRSKSEHCLGEVDDISQNSTPVLSAGETGGLDGVDGECGICFDLLECPTKTLCGHWYCSECVMSTIGIGSQGLCPICRSLVKASQLITFQPKMKGTMMTPLLDSTAVSMGNLSDDHSVIIKGVHMSSKFRTLLADLKKVREENPHAKVCTAGYLSLSYGWTYQIVF